MEAARLVDDVAVEVVADVGREPQAGALEGVAGKERHQAAHQQNEHKQDRREEDLAPAFDARPLFQVVVEAPGRRSQVLRAGLDGAQQPRQRPVASDLGKASPAQDPLLHLLLGSAQHFLQHRIDQPEKRRRGDAEDDDRGEGQEPPVHVAAGVPEEEGEQLHAQGSILRWGSEPASGRRVFLAAFGGGGPEGPRTQR